MKLRRIGWIALGAAAVTLAVAMLTLRGGGDTVTDLERGEPHDRPSLPDTLRMATLYGPTSYFTYRDQEMGMDYEMASRFARDNGMALKVEVASSVPEMLEMLRRGDVDLLAYEVPRIAEYQKDLLFCGRSNVTHQVLVQPSQGAVKDVTALVGQTVYVEKDSKYQYRLQNLNDEIGGGIGIEAVITDTLETTDLVRMVSRGELPLTVTDSDLAQICAKTFGNLDVSLPVGMDQFASWAVGADDKVLADAVNRWVKQNDVEKQYAEMHKRYFEHLAEAALEEETPGESSGAVGNVPRAGTDAPRPTPAGAVSPYDAIFKKYAAEIGWDWRQLAAIGYTESKFDPKIVSWAGARGLMQLMPGTARAYGVADRMDDPDASVYGATRVLRDLDKQLSQYVPDPQERRKFVIASYNSGAGHVLDAIALAKKYGKNPQVWYGNVREMALLKTKPQYYNDPVVKHGYFRGQETVGFVDKVLSTYDRFRGAD